MGNGTAAGMQQKCNECSGFKPFGSKCGNVRVIDATTSDSVEKVCESIDNDGRFREGDLSCVIKSEFNEILLHSMLLE
jgi:hypothetical protein